MKRSVYISKPLYRDEVLTRSQTTADLVSAIFRAIRESRKDAESLAQMISPGSVKDEATDIYKLIRRLVRYKREPLTYQTSKTIARIISDGYGDCKHFTILAASMAKALGYKVAIRTVMWPGRNSYSHVYPVILHEKNEYPIDGCAGHPLFQGKFKKNRDYLC